MPISPEAWKLIAESIRAALPSLGEPMADAMPLTPNQQALVNKIVNGNCRLVKCGGGYALWDNSIKWSQGRTPSNAITDSDIAALERNGLLEKGEYGSFRETFRLFSSAKDELTNWTPANEGYTGPSFSGN